AHRHGRQDPQVVRTCNCCARADHSAYGRRQDGRAPRQPRARCARRGFAAQRARHRGAHRRQCASSARRGRFARAHRGSRVRGARARAGAHDHQSADGTSLRARARSRAHSMIRIAAIGDVHAGARPSKEWVDGCARLAAEADLLLYAGDLTQHGALNEAEALVAPLKDAGIPVVAILGNHDYNLGQEHSIRRMMERSGICVVEGSATTVEVAGARVGVAGAKGFAGGFSGASASAFGEEAMKAFVKVTRDAANALGEALAGLRCDVRVALTHYSPARDTLYGEKPEVYPFLGSYLLG